MAVVRLYSHRFVSRRRYEITKVLVVYHKPAHILYTLLLQLVVIYGLAILQ
jgi:hypothetical protein